MRRRRPLPIVESTMTATIDSLRDQRHREEHAIRRQERAAEAEIARFDLRLRRLRAGIERTERAIEAEWRAEHWGRDPERPPAWR